jgi:DNA-directed RNA polymerase specialized sigma24 family protein
MNLVDAFREIAPVEGDASTQARRREAAGLVFEELQSIAEKIWTGLDVEERRDAAAKVLVRLMNNGPRRERADDPDTEKKVRAYLWKCVENGLKDFLRRSRRVDLPENFDPIDPAIATEDEASHREARERLHGAATELFESIIPRLARETRVGQALGETVDQLRQIRAGTLTVSSLVESEIAAKPEPRDARRVRNRLDQRFSRAFARISGEIDRLERQGDCSLKQAQALRVVLDGLRLRQ